MKSFRDPLKDVFNNMIFNLFGDGDDNLLIFITRGHDVAASIFNPIFVVQLELTAAWMSLKKGHSKNFYVSIRSKANSIPSVMANTPSRITECRKSFKVSHCAADSNGNLVINLTIKNHLATILNLKFSYCWIARKLLTFIYRQHLRIFQNLDSSEHFLQFFISINFDQTMLNFCVEVNNWFDLNIDEFFQVFGFNVNFRRVLPSVFVDLLSLPLPCNISFLDELDKEVFSAVVIYFANLHTIGTLAGLEHI